MVRKDHSRDNDNLPLPRPTGVAWHRSSRLHQTQTIRRALDFQRQLENAVQDVVRLAGPTPPVDGTGADLQRLSNELTESSSGLHDFFSDFASTALHNERRSDDSCPARRVFDLPEVLEQILSYLDTLELLRAMEVDRTMYQAIESSPLLQERLFLRPAADGPLKVPFLASPSRLRERGLKRGTPSPSPGFPLFTCRASPDASTRLAGITAKFSRELPRLGNRCRAMLVCQPPIHTMGVYALCCSHNPYSFGAGNGRTPTAAPKSFAVEMMGPSEMPEPPFEILTAERGITVGDLYDMTVQTRDIHDRCPWAPPSEHNDQGDVFAVVSFGGAVELQSDDPAIAGGPFANIGGILPPEIPTDVDLYSSTRPAELLERYAAVKRRAYYKGEPRPSFQEFKDGIDAVTGLYPGEEQVHSWA